MPLFRSVIDTFTLGSERPIRRLLAYYAVLGAIGALVLWLWPAASELFFDETSRTASEAPYLLQDGLSSTLATVAPGVPSTIHQLLLTALSLVGAIGLMLPVSWVYMSARNIRGHNQAVVQTLLILPIVVAGIVFVVRNSLALAFSLAGVVAAVRFRTTLRDARDVVFIFLAIAVGFAAGVSMLGAGTLVSIMFNFVVLLTWRYDFGRNMLAPTAASQWRDPLSSLAASNGHTQVPDRDLLLALTPTKVSQLAERFDRVRAVMGTTKGKPRFNAVLSVTSDHVSEAQALVQRALDDCVKRWVLDEVVTHAGKPSELFYLVRVARKTTRDEILTAVRAQAGDKIGAADLEIAASVEETEAA
jgi:hypothetical protein